MTENTHVGNRAELSDVASAVEDSARNAKSAQMAFCDQAEHDALLEKVAHEWAYEIALDNLLEEYGHPDLPGPLFLRMSRPSVKSNP